MDKCVYFYSENTWYYSYHPKTNEPVEHEGTNICTKGKIVNICPYEGNNRNCELLKEKI